MVITHSRPSSLVRSGLREINLQTDLRALADLINEAFADELDAAGRASLREMRTMAHMGPLLGLFMVGSDWGGLRGFVWEADGRVVGCTTMQRADTYGRRWIIANVAVHPVYRGRGIARQLMEATLDRIRQLGGEWAVLQVRPDNAAARHLYERLGFEDLFIETTLRHTLLPSLQPPLIPMGAQIRLLTDADRAAVNALLYQATPDLARWWQTRRQHEIDYGSDGAILSAWGRLTGQGYRRRLGLFVAGELVGMVDADVRPRRDHRLDLLVHPHERGRWEALLVALGLAELHGYPQRGVTATLYDYQPEAIAALEAAGFRPVLRLATMRKSVRSLGRRPSAGYTYGEF
jgi:ribosomal protein S18 acetylase RimI-like enzyme